MEVVKPIIITLTGGQLDGEKREITPGAHSHGLCHFWKDEPGSESLLYGFSKTKNAWVWVDLDFVPEVLPTSGRIVWYVPSANYVKLSKLNAGQPYPAIVIEVEKQSSAVVLRVFTP